MAITTSGPAPRLAEPHGGLRSCSSWMMGETSMPPFCAIRGMGGTLVKTDVDLEWVKRVQASLADSSDTTRPIGHSVPSERGES